MRTENFGGKELWAGDPCQAEGRGGLKQSTYRRAMSGWGEPTHLKDLSPFEAQKRLDQVPSAAFSSAQREGERERGKTGMLTIHARLQRNTPSTRHNARNCAALAIARATSRKFLFVRLSLHSRNLWQLHSVSEKLIGLQMAPQV